MRGSACWKSALGCVDYSSDMFSVVIFAPCISDR